jgi:hypothetical protein
MPYHVPSGSEEAELGMHPEPSAPSGFGDVVVDVGSVVLVPVIVDVVVVRAVVLVARPVVVVTGPIVVVASTTGAAQAATNPINTRVAKRLLDIIPVSLEPGDEVGDFRCSDVSRRWGARTWVLLVR